MKKIIIMFFLISVNVFAESVIQTQLPYPTYKDLMCISFADENTGFASGKESIILKTTNAGINWTETKVTLNSQSSKIYHMDFPSAQIGFVINYFGEVFKTTNGGNTFFNIPAPSSGYSLDNGIKFINESIGFLYTNGLYRTTDGGNNWENLTSSEITKVKALKFYNNKLYLIGFNGVTSFRLGISDDLGNTFTFKRIGNISNTPLHKFDIVGDHIYGVQTNTGSNGNDKLFKSTNNGDSWEQYQIDITSVFLRDLIFFDQNNGIVVYGNNELNLPKIVKTTDGGITWITSYFENYKKLSFANAVKVSNQKAYICGGVGLILKTENKGSSWSELSHRVTTEDLKSVSFSNQNIGIVVGNSGTVLRTINGGISWIKLNLNTDINLNKVFIFSDGIGYITGDISGYYRTTDFGLSWDYKNMSQYGAKFYSTFFNSNVGAIIGGDSLKLIKTTNGGESWTHKLLPMAGGSYPGNSYSDLEGLICIGEEKFVGMRSSSGAHGSSSITINYTTNGGNNWIGGFSNSSGYGFSSYTAAAPEFIFVSYTESAGVSRIRVTQNFFQTYNTLINAATRSSFINSNLGIIATGNRLQVTNNSGSEWNRIGEFTNFISELRMIDPENAYIVSDKGVICKIEIDWLVGINSSTSSTPEKFLLSQNYPNPFNPTTNIKFSLPTTQYTILKVFDIAGREKVTLVNEQLNAGEYNYQFNADDYGLSSGVYFYQLFTEEFVQTRKLTLIK